MLNFIHLKSHFWVYLYFLSKAFFKPRVKTLAGHPWGGGWWAELTGILRSEFEEWARSDLAIIIFSFAQNYFLFHFHKVDLTEAVYMSIPCSRFSWLGNPNFPSTDGSKKSKVQEIILSCGSPSYICCASIIIWIYDAEEAYLTTYQITLNVT